MRVHDVLDEVDDARRPFQTLHDHIMTTWHDQESLDDALFAFAHAAVPAEEYVESCTAWLAVVVGDGAVASEVRSWLESEDEMKGAGPFPRDENP